MVSSPLNLIPAITVLQSNFVNIDRSVAGEHKWLECKDSQPDATVRLNKGTSGLADLSGASKLPVRRQHQWHRFEVVI